MSFIRASFTVIQAVVHQAALTCPNPTPKKGRYHTEAHFILQVAPLIFWIHSVVLWALAAFETLAYLCSLVPASPPYVSTLVCPASTLHSLEHPPTPLFLIGFTSILCGALIRIDCFYALGELFTFDLTIHPEHRLIMSRSYAHVRHPAYAGSMLLVMGISIAHFTRGSWAVECAFGTGWGRVVMYPLWGLWWLWTLSVGISRAKAEDRQMNVLFGEQWVKYAEEVQWWFFPCLL
ncbi:uncharacterized protein BT62DRAFT_893212 [Guyanagaster necrorhizus]|uniref:Protein-S-isoprenylcysteine O-methyltransferase n=1 Tax=Guyanagaster necrorhizus TaxID=856835 RepID=A0A9P8ATV7_9AGAR|nr:uncharacterized protein BT62DRAFT_893212 [Guyanagaster necrorhizus MCA 3950]KAG7447411.1 hypothetical protein BT62DRAFT_893212 [Guyanagaster necrorhizus MCA 3950]